MDGISWDLCKYGIAGAWYKTNLGPFSEFIVSNQCTQLNFHCIRKEFQLKHLSDLILLSWLFYFVVKLVPIHLYYLFTNIFVVVGRVLLTHSFITSIKLRSSEGSFVKSTIIEKNKLYQWQYPVVITMKCRNFTLSRIIQSERHWALTAVWPFHIQLFFRLKKFCFLGLSKQCNFYLDP